jgi:hypothetical protein
MTNQLAKRALGAGFAAALVLGAAACGDDDDINTDELEQDVEGIGGDIEEEGGEIDE